MADVLHCGHFLAFSTGLTVSTMSARPEVCSITDAVAIVKGVASFSLENREWSSSSNAQILATVLEATNETRKMLSMKTNGKLSEFFRSDQ